MQLALSLVMTPSISQSSFIEFLLIYYFKTFLFIFEMKQGSGGLPSSPFRKGKKRNQRKRSSLSGYFICQNYFAYLMMKEAVNDNFTIVSRCTGVSCLLRFVVSDKIKYFHNKSLMVICYQFLFGLITNINFLPIINNQSQTCVLRVIIFLW